MTKGEKYFVDDEGVMRVRKVNCRRIRGYETFMPDREYAYPCMDMDGDRLFLLTLVGGWFGLHKFMTGKFLQGVGYAISGGLGGVFYVLDLVAMLLGSYVHEVISFEAEGHGSVVRKSVRYYNRPVVHRALGWFGVAAAVGIAVVVVRWVYVPGFTVVSEIVGRMLR